MTQEYHTLRVVYEVDLGMHLIYASLKGYNIPEKKYEGIRGIINHNTNIITVKPDEKSEEVAIPQAMYDNIKDFLPPESKFNHIPISINKSYLEIPCTDPKTLPEINYEEKQKIFNKVKINFENVKNFLQSEQNNIFENINDTKFLAAHCYKKNFDRDKEVNSTSLFNLNYPIESEVKNGFQKELEKIKNCIPIYIKDRQDALNKLEAIIKDRNFKTIFYFNPDDYFCEIEYCHGSPYSILLCFKHFPHANAIVIKDKKMYYADQIIFAKSRGDNRWNIFFDCCKNAMECSSEDLKNKTYAFEQLSSFTNILAENAKILAKTTKNRRHKLNQRRMVKNFKTAKQEYKTYVYILLIMTIYVIFYLSSIISESISPKLK